MVPCLANVTGQFSNVQTYKFEGKTREIFVDLLHLLLLARDGYYLPGH